MSDLHKAAQQALEAMESYRNMMFVEAGCRFKEGEAAITALRDALAQQEQEQEPVAWQSLTEEDMEDLLPLYSDPSANTEMLEFAAAIEAALKEKNHD